MKSYRDVFIDGEWIASTGSSSIHVIDPTTEEVLGSVPAGTAEDVEQAVRAATQAQPAWMELTAAERAGYLRRVAKGLSERRDEAVSLVVSEVGTPLTQARVMQVDIAIHTFAEAADLIEGEAFEERIANSVIVRDPMGVVGAITPWNYPLYQIALKVAPALAAGCTVVLKPSEVAGLSPYLLAEVFECAGVPKGVFNLVSGSGPQVGEAIARHPDVDMVSFTGSIVAGRRVAEVASATVKKVALELGGKSATVVLEDADLPAAVAHSVPSCFSNAGQTCASLTRLIVPRPLLPEVERLVCEVAAEFVAGNPHSAETRLGPLVSAAQRDRVRGYIDDGIRDGAKLLVGGPGSSGLPGRGYFVNATAFSEVTPSMTIAQEEIFGPVLAILPVDDEDEAVHVANGTRFGLSGSVWSRDEQRARRVGAKLYAGTVYINGGKFNPSAPFGGCKQSGYGRERGRFGLEEFSRLKAFQF